MDKVSRLSESYKFKYENWVLKTYHTNLKAVVISDNYSTVKYFKGYSLTRMNICSSWNRRVHFQIKTTVFQSINTWLYYRFLMTFIV
jgi:hypothetical protein